jgi:hypothetical protein
MLLLIAGVQIGVARLAGWEHLTQDFQQSLAQASQGTEDTEEIRGNLTAERREGNLTTG